MTRFSYPACYLASLSKSFITSYREKYNIYFEYMDNCEKDNRVKQYVMSTRSQRLRGHFYTAKLLQTVISQRGVLPERSVNARGDV